MGWRGRYKGGGGRWEDWGWEGCEGDCGEEVWTLGIVMSFGEV